MTWLPNYLFIAASCTLLLYTQWQCAIQTMFYWHGSKQLIVNFAKYGMTWHFTSAHKPASASTDK